MVRAYLVNTPLSALFSASLFWQPSSFHLFNRLGLLLYLCCAACNVCVCVFVFCSLPSLYLFNGLPLLFLCFAASLFSPFQQSGSVGVPLLCLLQCLCLCLCVSWDTALSSLKKREKNGSSLSSLVDLLFSVPLLCFPPPLLAYLHSLRTR